MMNLKPSNRKIILVGVWVILITWHIAALAESGPTMAIGHFSAENGSNRLPTHWEPFYFKGVQQHTDYRLTEEDGHVKRVKRDAGKKVS